MAKKSSEPTCATQMHAEVEQVEDYSNGQRRITVRRQPCGLQPCTRAKVLSQRYTTWRK